jgi:hypothetical protein
VGDRANTGNTVAAEVRHICPVPEEANTISPYGSAISRSVSFMILFGSAMVGFCDVLKTEREGPDVPRYVEIEIPAMLSRSNIEQVLK